MRLVVGTANGVVELDGGAPRRSLQRRRIGALSRSGEGFWAVADGRELLRGDTGRWEVVAEVRGDPATCVLAAPEGVFVGTAGAHLLELEQGELRAVAAFEQAEDRALWHTPWGGPPDLRSLCAQDGSLFANVHVGGIQRSTDGGGRWRPTIDIEADVHEVRGGGVPGLVLAACALGLAVSRDGGASWVMRHEGLPVTYERSLAVSADHVLVGASSGPGGQRSGVHRAQLAGGAFVPCATGLPAGYSRNIDTFCLDAAGETVAFGTREGSLFVSGDQGETWSVLESGLGEVLAVMVVE